MRKSPILCNHANEVPAVCPCLTDCWCKNEDGICRICDADYVICGTDYVIDKKVRPGLPKMDFKQKLKRILYDTRWAGGFNENIWESDDNKYLREVTYPALIALFESSLKK